MQLKPIPRPTPTKVATAHSSTVDLTRFQRFIRRMEGAGPKVILDRIKEDWSETAGEEADEEVSLALALAHSWKISAYHLLAGS